MKGLLRKIARHYRRPSGLLGRLIGFSMSRGTRAANEWAIELLDVQPDSAVLEVGFGPGVALRQLAGLAAEGRVVGVDHSETMVGQARRRNAEAVREGRVELHCGRVAALPYEDDTFDRVLAVHVIYFMADPVADLGEICRVMRPGGRIVICMWDNSDPKWQRESELAGAEALYSGDEAAALLTEAGFRNAQWEENAAIRRRAVCVVAEK